MIVIDSSAWIEFFKDGALTPKIEKYFSHPESIVIPSLVLFEVYRVLAKKSGAKEALFAVTQMKKGLVQDLTEDLALQAAELSLEHQLATADSIVYATALFHKADLLTLDNDFRNLQSCRVLP